jgi:peroxiredoxin
VPLTSRHQGASSTAPRPGEQLPAFALPSAAGAIVRLWDFKQRQPLLLAFTHGVDCPACRARLAQLARERARLDEAGAALLVLAPEPIERLRTLQAELALPFTLLARDECATAAYLPAPAGDGVVLYAADRYGECVGAWLASDANSLPALDAPLADLALADQNDCACAMPAWEDDDDRQ